MSIGRIIQSIREEKDMNQKELAEKIGVSYSVMNRIELGERPARDEEIKKIADVLEISTDYLLGRTNDKNSNSSTLTEKDEKDIAKTMEKLKNKLADEEGLMFDGEPLDEETARLLMEAIESQERMVKVINKKYIPKKHRKE